MKLIFLFFFYEYLIFPIIRIWDTIEKKEENSFHSVIETLKKI